MTHTPVLADEVLRLLDPRPGETYVDATAGLGGHARRVAERLGPTGRVILLDLDADNVARAAETVRGAAECEVIPIHASFTELARLLRELPGAADLILADLGFASNQVDDPARGLSFKRDGPLDMRLDPTAVITAADLVAELPEKELADLIYEYGEERLSRKIARFLVAERKAEPITTTARLAMLVRRAYGRQRGRSRIDPATRTFQALRIAVNDELGNLGSLLEDVARSAGRGQDADWLAPGARIAMISFHSLEDRLIKRAFADMVERGWATGLTKKPITADARGIEENPRARSAKLRAVRLAGGAHASLDSPTARQT
ncbi:MAG: 16S rRNA (cytosine(1402)-N(4))-methyltransferase RsmH [Phycisphaerales bacterium]|nr:16S rRNA (cytosine(1402)-N(4))-methyltransferase RsmH [Phycisphaerales bacterium]